LSHLKNIGVFLILLLLSGFNTLLFAQTETKAANNAPLKIKAYRIPTPGDYDSWDFGAHFGLTYGSTDIASSKMGIGSKKLAFGVDATKFISHSFGIQARFLTGGLKGTDDVEELFQYKTSINYDLTLNALFQIGNLSFLSRKHEIAIYGTIGAGVINFTPKVSIDGGITELAGIYSQYTQPYEYPDYKSTSALVVPIGIGLKYHVSPKLSITGEYSYRTTQSDKLDGFFKLLSADDHYSSLNFGVAYHFGHKGKSLEWANPLKSLYDDYYAMKEKFDLLGVDNDNDGVVDLFDREPDTKAGAKVYGDGKAIDTDGDGIPDISDSDPFSNMKSKIDATGKSIDNVSANDKDSDGDGIPDSRDSEIFSAKGARVDASGKEIVVIKSEKKSDETTANLNESAKKADEANRKAEEASKKAEESNRKAAEAISKADASAQKAEEAIRKADEAIKKANESVSKSNDNSVKISSAPAKTDAPVIKIDESAKNRDSDGDGIADYLDTEPFSIRGARVDNTGKELAEDVAARKKDTDGDGIPDFMDADPNSRKGAKVNSDGREVTPSEGISIAQEKAPVKAPPMEKKEPAPVYVPEVAGTPSNFDLPTVYFGVDQDEVTSKFYDELISFGLLMHNNPSLNFRVIGNCDTKGSSEYNIELGKRRAEAVKTFLINNCKVDGSRLITETSGKQNTIGGVGVINRRVDILIK
jgi:OOP family OmpA-OmpF porin